VNRPSRHNGGAALFNLKGKWKMENVIQKKHHGGSPEDRRLSSMLDVLKQYPEGLTTLQIDNALQNRGVRNVAISTTISDLRKNGIPISKAQFVRTSENGMKIYFYKMEA
jgi:hypothetical protein